MFKRWGVHLKMLFEKKDLIGFENKYDRETSQEAFQSHYSRNNRFAVVFLFSLVMFNLYNKLHYMAEENEPRAKNVFAKVNELIEGEEKNSWLWK